MRPLTTEEIEGELNSFPRHRLSQKAAADIASSLGSASRQKRKSRPLFPAIASAVLIAILAIGIPAVAWNLLSEEQSRQTPGASAADRFTIDTFNLFNIEKLSPNEAEFRQGNKKVGGIAIMTEDEMNNAISEQHVFEKVEREGYEYPLLWTLDHQKTMEAIQIHHYFFLAKESRLRYHVYFYTPNFEEEEIEKIVKTFRIHE